MTLTARGSELERDFAYGVVRQLFEAPLAAMSPLERTGAARRRGWAGGTAVRRSSDER